MPELSNIPEYTISEISALLKKSVEEKFAYVKVRGEISGYKQAASGHCYLDLKDEQAVLKAVCWKQTASRLSCQMEDGLEVVATGRMTTYPGRSYYQLVIDSLEPAGAGALMALLDKRRKALAAEGLFDAAHKKPLPFLPSHIGIVTSPTGAVIRDILHRLEERFPVRVSIWPVLVQGEGAAQQIAAAIEGFEKIKPDLLIVARGGGSLEDLWAFNEESVVRAAANSTIPLISAVGHETDTTLIDFVSDRRAPTPTAAAEMAVPVRLDLANTITHAQARLFASIQRSLNEKSLVLKSLNLLSPLRILETMMVKLDDWSGRFATSLPKFFADKEQRLKLAEAKLQIRPIERELTRHAEKLHDLSARKNAAFTQLLEKRTQQIGSLGQLLESYHYGKVLKRGFAIVRDETGKLVTSAKQLTPAQRIAIELTDSQVNARVE